MLPTGNLIQLELLNIWPLLGDVMLKVLLYWFIAILLFFNTASAQTDVRITDLSGIRDNNGITHLIYQTKYHSLGLEKDSSLFDYYIFNTQTAENKLLFNDYTIESYNALPPGDFYGESVADYKFFGGDPNKFICAYNGLFGDAYCYISRYDSPNSFTGTSFINKLHISGVDTNMVFACLDNLIMKSTDAGRTWPAFDDTNIVHLEYNYIQHSPFDDDIVYMYNLGWLYKSIDGGKTATKIDFLMYPGPATKMFFDIDQSHIYVTNEYGIYVSDNCGEPDSWKKVFESDRNKINMLYDSTSGNIYFFIGKQLFKSTDKLLTYNLMTEFPEKIFGIYKKSFEDIIYIAFCDRIEEFDFHQSRVILKKIINKSLELFPLSVGNEWTYYCYGVSYDKATEYFSFSYKNKIVSDTISSSGQHYYKYVFIKQYSYGAMDSCWLRIDSLTSKIYGTYSIGGEEITFFDFRAYDIIDYEPEESGYLTFVDQSDTLLWNRRREMRKFFYASLWIQEKYLVQGLGQIYRHDEFDFGDATHKLLGCVINGVVYGDTVLVDVSDNVATTPIEFQLFQNFPNPFNPSTTIKYSIPSETNGHALSRQFVTLKIHDVLGREITTLVNEEKSSGNYEITFNAGGLPSGVYFYSLQIGKKYEVKKMLLLK